ncbi:hypothetical protein KHP62_14640 [Rhodobacteraceae bacterium NNCM2]|nr:hypothetical protein [Coraliihabitans acroporae]
MKPLHGDTLPEDAPDPEAYDVTPGWIGRNRASIERGRNLGRMLMLVAPPPARLALAAVSVAADAVLLANDVKRRMKDPAEGAVGASVLALEGAALLAMSRFAPARLAANLAGIEAVRAAVKRAAGERGYV